MSWPLWMKEPGPRDWPEDAIRDDDNGCYMNICCVCKEEFIGHKRRPVCKMCALSDEREQQVVNQFNQMWKSAAGFPPHSQ